MDWHPSLKRANVTMFATAFHGVIDLERLTLTYSCAGHPGPVVVDADGGRQLCTERGEKGQLSGYIPTRSYSLQTLDLSKTQRLLLFTDGVLEAENKDGEQFMENRLMQLASEDTGAPVGSWLDSIIETVLNFSDGHHFDDDVCLLGIEITRKQ